MQGEAYDFLFEYFLSPEVSGYIGPLVLVICGYFLFKKDRTLGILWFIVECLFISQYLLLVGTTPDYWWQIIILMFGGFFTCVFPLWDR